MDGGLTARELSGEEGAPRSVRSVYVHAPFCVRRCTYCDFAVTVSPAADVPGWAEALAAELDFVAREGLFELAPLLDTLYVGGGTPSLLGSRAMDELATLLGRDRLGGDSLEWTVEANPESFTPALATAWKSTGVSRVSLGVQSFHAPTLRWMGRLHGPDGASSAVAAARGAGLDNLTVDLMFGLPAHLGRSWARDLDLALALDVPHLSLYGLGVEANTPLGRAVAEGREPTVDEERYGQEYLEAADRLGAEGYAHYEVSSFARPGYESRHNSAYWSGAPYLGLGSGAHSYAPPVRRWNIRDWAEYRRSLQAGSSPEAGREAIEGEALALERIWLGLRTVSGLGVAKLGDEGRQLLRRWERHGLARVSHDRVHLTARGWLQLDGLAVDLEQVWAGGTRVVPYSRLDP